MKHYVVIAGLPARYHDELRRKLGELERRYRNLVFVSSPVPVQQAAGYDSGYIKSLESRLVKALSAEKEDCGLLFLYTRRDEQPFNSLGTFSRTSIIASIKYPDREGQSFQETARTVNSWIGEIGAIYERFRVVIPTIRDEVVNKRNKTPLLLPLKNFRSRDLDDLVLNLASQIANFNAETAASYVSAQITNFNAHHSPKQVEDSQMRFYSNDDGTVFKAPGKHLHAIPPDNDSDHQSSCKLEGRLRVGHSFHPSFHYDCLFRTRAVREIPSCHGTFERPGKSDHVNIAPNDFARKAG